MIKLRQGVLLISLILIGMQWTVIKAQTPQVTLSPEFKLGNNKSIQGHIDSDESGHYVYTCLLYTSPSPRDQRGSRMPSSA